VVTGANGFVGQKLVAAFATAGHHVVAASRRPVTVAPGVEWRKSPDLGCDADWKTVLRDADVVVHAAARVHVMNERERDPLAEFRRINVDGTIALARQAAQMGSARFLLISTIKVHGETTTDRPFTPGDRVAPVDPYGLSKWEAECAVARIGDQTGMETAAIRPVLVYGAGVGGNMAMLARLAARGWPVPLGAVRNRRSLVHVDNLADLVVRAATFHGPIPPVMLVCDDEAVSTAELVRRLARASGRRPRVPAVPLWILSGAASLMGKRAWSDRLLQSLEADDRATRHALGWSPPVTLSQGLGELAGLRGPGHEHGVPGSAGL
jgi:nucleoside-diphosphate-sugar epimerase